MRQALRYENLVREIKAIQPRRILEVGTCKGERAEKMILAAAELADNIAYFGFDLFENPPEGEFSGSKQPASLADVWDRLGRLPARIILTPGDTRETLPGFHLDNVDLAFIDGGHSEETVRSDFAAVLPMMRDGGSIMMDDYWNFPEGGGCKPVVDELDPALFHVELLEPVDEFRKPWGTLRTQIVRVRKRANAG